MVCSRSDLTISFSRFCLLSFFPVALASLAEDEWDLQWLALANSVGGDIGFGMVSKKVCGQLVHCLGRRMYFETSLLLRASTSVALAQDARDSEVMLRGKGVVWNLPIFFTREGALLPEGFLKTNLRLWHSRSCFSPSLHCHRQVMIQ